MSNFLQNLTIKDAFMFAAVMSDEEQCRHLLELVLDTKVGIGIGYEDFECKCCDREENPVYKRENRCKTSKYRFYSGFIIMTETSNPLSVLPAV